MKLTRRSALQTVAAAATLPIVRPARAQGATIKIGVLNDQSGPYTNTGGITSVICAKQALEDFGVATKGMNVEVISADHQNKPDLAVSITRQWFDRDGVDVLLDVPTSSVALAVQSVVREKNKVYLNVGAASSALTGAQCSPELHSLGVRHLHAVEVDRRCDGEGGRRVLVFPDRRLCVRQAVAGRYLDAGQGGGRQGAGFGAVSVPGNNRFLVVPGAGAVQRSEGAGAGQCRRRHGELDQAGARSSASTSR